MGVLRCADGFGSEVAGYEYRMLDCLACLAFGYLPWMLHLSRWNRGDDSMVVFSMNVLWSTPV